MQSQVRTWALAAAATLLGAASASAQYSEGFETYPNGWFLAPAGQGPNGWHQWDNFVLNATQADETIVSAPAPVHNGNKSLGVRYTSDAVQAWTTYTTGHWDVHVWTYVDSAMSASQYLVFLTDYNPTTATHVWSTQMEFNAGIGQVVFDIGYGLTTCGLQYGAAVPIVYNQWVEVLIDIDVDADVAKMFYNGTQIGEPFSWSQGPFGYNGQYYTTPAQWTGSPPPCPPPAFPIKAIRAIDLYSGSPAYAAGTGCPEYMYYDDIAITPHTPQPSNYCTVGTSVSGNCNPAITYAGTPSASAASGFMLVCNNVDANQTGLFFYGVTNTSFTPVLWGSTGTSYFCVKAPVERMGVMSAGGSFGCSGNFAQDWNAFMATNPGVIGSPRVAGSSFDAQLWMRDPPSQKTTILSDALRFVLAP